MTDTGVCEVVITAEDPEWLAEFTRGLVEDRLAACGHHIEVIRSIYRWDAQVHDEPEARVNLHTRLELVDRIVERTKTRHSYDVPCVFALPVVAGNPDYIDWILAETTTASLTGCGTSTLGDIRCPDSVHG